MTAQERAPARPVEMDRDDERGDQRHDKQGYPGGKGENGAARRAVRDGGQAKAP